MSLIVQCGAINVLGVKITSLSDEQSRLVI